MRRRGVKLGAFHSLTTLQPPCLLQLAERLHGLEVLLVGARAAVGVARSERKFKRQMHQGNMDELDDAQFKCMRRGTAVRAYIPTHKTRLVTAPYGNDLRGNVVASGPLLGTYKPRPSSVVGGRTVQMTTPTNNTLNKLLLGTAVVAAFVLVFSIVLFPPATTFFALMR